MNCNSCRFWNRDEEDIDCYAAFHMGLGMCEAAKQFWDSTEWSDEPSPWVAKEEWQSAPSYRVFTPAAANTLAFTQDGSDYKATLWTKPEFGCLMFKEKDK